MPSRTPGMLTGFDFHVTQLRYIKAALSDILSYSPDGMNAAAPDAVLTGAAAVRPRGNPIQSH